MKRDALSEKQWFQKIVSQKEAVLSHRANALGGTLQEWTFPEAPFYILPEHAKFIALKTELIVQTASKAAQQIVEKAAQDVTFRPSDFELPHWVWTWMIRLKDVNSFDLGYGRPDTHFNGLSLQLLEFNLTSLAGSGFEVSCVVDYFNNHPCNEGTSSFQEYEMPDPLEGLACALNELLKTDSQPNKLVCFLSTRTAFPGAEPPLPFEKTTTRMRKNLSVPIIGAYVEDVIFRDGCMYLSSGQKVTHSFCNLYSPQNIERSQMFIPVWNCAWKGGLKLLDSLQDVLKSHKALLALMKNHPDFFSLNLEETAVLQSNVPETKLLYASEIAKNTPLEIAATVESILAKPADWVLKKAKSAQSRDVYVGRFAPLDRWKTLVHQAVEEGGWIAQKFATPHRRVLPYLVNNRIVALEVDVLVCPFVVRGKVVAHSVRMYSDQLIKGSENGNIGEANIRFAGPSAWKTPNLTPLQECFEKVSL